MVTALDDQDRAVLEFARRRHCCLGCEEAAARADLGISMTVYSVRLMRLLDNPAALEVDAQLVYRLRRIRDRRRAARSPQRGGVVS